MEPARRLIVHVLSGHLRGTKAVLAPGSSLRVGRTERAELMIERDAQMSGLHFEIAWDGTSCTLKDLGSVKGTKLSGATIGGPERVPHGGWIQAGETSFSVHFEAHSPSRATEFPDPKLAAAARAALVPHRDAGRLYAVFDAARDERILELCRESVDETRSLYEGPKGDALADVAPYLVFFRPDSGLLDRLVSEGWGLSWGVFLTSQASFKNVRRHFRRFLLVEDDETGERMYFRFYDARVLRDFLPLATPRQHDMLFADLESFVFEGERGEVVSFERPSTLPARTEESHAQNP